METKRLQGLTRPRLTELLERMRQCRAVLIGDMCLDVYWFADMTRSKLSRETPHFPLPVVSEKMSAGAGGNAAVNLSVLCDHVTPIGVIGEDWRGHCLRDVLTQNGLPTHSLVTVRGGVTNAYCKPMRRGYAGVDVEDPRIDFEMTEPLPTETEDALLEKLNAACENADVLCVSDQLACGCISERVRARINQLAAQGLLTVVDSRSRIALYRNCILKPNELECARALSDLGCNTELNACDEASVARGAAALSERTDSAVCLTLGEHGCLIRKNGESTRVRAIPTTPPIDTVGAGDCFLSAFSLALAAGATDAEAGVIGAMASAITVKKINTTGSANQEELLALLEREGK